MELQEMQHLEKISDDYGQLNTNKQTNRKKNPERAMQKLWNFFIPSGYKLTALFYHF